jgi:hypothetical protein
VLTACVRPFLTASLAVLALAPAGAKAEQIHVFEGVPELGPAPTGPCASTTAQAAAGPTVLGTLARLRQQGALSDEDAARFEDGYRHARVVRDGLGGLRKRELSAAIAQVQVLAARRLLTASRAPVVFMQLARNTEYWPAGKIPTAPQPKVRPCAGKAGLGGARVMFGDDQVVYQWYPGQGLQIQELGTFGRANALANACRPEAGPSSIPCDQDKLRAALDAIVALAVDRGGFKAWEYYFTFSQGRPPWISGLAQGTAMQALTRGTEVLGDPKYRDLAGEALGAFTRRSPVGVRTTGPHFLLYSFAPGLRVFNAFFQAMNGIYDYAQSSGDQHAKDVFAGALPEARREAAQADTGAWSRYSVRGAESDLGYHKLVRDFLRGLCDRTQASVFCATADRFTGYLREGARVRLVRAGRGGVRVLLSKVSCVILRVNGGFAGVRVLPRGAGTLPWAPRRGRYRVTVDAQDLAGHHTRITRTVTVR